MNKTKSESGFWIELPDEATIVSKPNFVNLTHMIDQMRGSRTTEQFARDCHIASSTLFRTYRGERIRPMLYKHLKAMYLNKDPKCRLNFDDLLATNGMVRSEVIKDAQDQVRETNELLATETGRNSKNKKKLNKELHTKHPSTKVLEYECSNINPENEKTTFDSSMEYKQFIKDLAIYAQGLSKEDYYSLSTKKDELFKDKWFVEMLGKYCKCHSESFEKNKEKIKKYFMSGQGLQELDRSAEYYRDLLDNFLGFSSRASDYLKSLQTKK